MFSSLNCLEIISEFGDRTNYVEIGQPSAQLMLFIAATTTIIPPLSWLHNILLLCCCCYGNAAYGVQYSDGGDQYRNNYDVGRSNNNYAGTYGNKNNDPMMLATTYNSQSDDNQWAWENANFNSLPYYNQRLGSGVNRNVYQSAGAQIPLESAPWTLPKQSSWNTGLVNQPMYPSRYVPRWLKERAYIRPQEAIPSALPQFINQEDPQNLSNDKQTLALLTRLIARYPGAISLIEKLQNGEVPTLKRQHQLLSELNKVQRAENKKDAGKKKPTSTVVGKTNADDEDNDDTNESDELDIEDNDKLSLKRKRLDIWKVLRTAASVGDTALSVMKILAG